MLTFKLTTLRYTGAELFRSFIYVLLVGLTAMNGLGALTIETVRSTGRSSAASNITSPGVTTTSPNCLLLAFVSADGGAAGMTVTSVTGGGLTWTLVRRANGQLGTAEIWRAMAVAPIANVAVRANLAQSVAAAISVVAFAGADTSGSNGSGAIGNTAFASQPTGAPSASLVTTRNGSWVFGVGHDWDRAVARTPAAGQTVMYSFLATVGDTFWVQRQNNPTPLSGTTVFISDTAPTNDRFNLSIVEILPALTQGEPVYSISGVITPPASGAGTSLALAQNGTTIRTVVADSSGAYNFASLPNGAYTITPTKVGFVFTPTATTLTVNNGNLLANFSATAQTWSVSGSVTPAALGAGSSVALSGTVSRSTTVDASGNFSFANVPNGTYTITPTKTGVSFTPPNRGVAVSGANQSGLNFIAQTAQVGLNYPDLSEIIPAAQISITGTGANREFRYTHDTYNGGSGPLEIQPFYNPASGNYHGHQHVYSFNAGTWTLVRTIPVAGAFYFHAIHGHFHFPFASFGIYLRNADGSIGAPIAVSEKDGFCIADSFIYDPTLPNAGEFGDWGSCADPLSVRGLSIGAVDEYDRTDPGQSIFIPTLPNGRYWLRAVVDPDNLLAESNELNNETHADITITGNTVTVNQIIVPVLAPPPQITVSAPLAGNVSGTVDFTANTAVSSADGVRFLIDGAAFGSAVTTPPFTKRWDTTTVPNGQHWLSAQTTDPTGRVGTSEVVEVNVFNGPGTGTPPTVQITGPEENATVSAAVTISATATSPVGVPRVQFYIDGAALGSAITAPPFTISWNTVPASPGTHIITAVATDQLGQATTSAPRTVIVDNSNPPNIIGVDALVFADTSNTMQTPPFSTTTSSDLIVAFVAYDGPTTAAQTATVSGGGLTWQLAKRSNAQAGTSEIWTAKASSILSGVTVTSQPGISGFHGSLTVIAFLNASGPGTVGQASAPTGPPDIYLPGISAGNWVFAVGNDWDRAVARTPVAGQVLVHQRVDTQVGDTFWVQSTQAPSVGDGLVTIHDSAPTNDRWNYAAVEIVATRQ